MSITVFLILLALVCVLLDAFFFSIVSIAVQAAVNLVAGLFVIAHRWATRDDQRHEDL